MIRSGNKHLELITVGTPKLEGKILVELMFAS